MNMRYAFQDDDNCFFVLDLMLGGDLRCECRLPLFLYWIANSTLIWYNGSGPMPVHTHTVHMERKGEINERCVRFWTAELASACNYLHRQKIIHR